MSVNEMTCYISCRETIFYMNEKSNIGLNRWILLQLSKMLKNLREENKVPSNYDDLVVDRLHNRYTVAVLVCFCIAISTYQYAGKKKS